VTQKSTTRRTYIYKAASSLRRTQEDYAIIRNVANEQFLELGIQFFISLRQFEIFSQGRKLGVEQPLYDYYLIQFLISLNVLSSSPTVLVALFILIRIEKEKSQLKAEAEDLRGQIDHITKAKVSLSIILND
jgi:hypothetical protein